MERSPLPIDSTLVDWTRCDKIITTWMLKLAIPYLSQPVELLSSFEKIMDERDRIYGGSSDIIVDTFETILKLKVKFPNR